MEEWNSKLYVGADGSMFRADEVLVLLTPWAIKRPYIWLEIGAIWGQVKRIVGVLHGLNASELVAAEGTPALLKRIDLVELNRIDTYFAQLKSRVKRKRK